MVSLFVPYMILQVSGPFKKIYISDVNKLLVVEVKKKKTFFSARCSLKFYWKIENILN